jgi:hypothetical protein
MVTKMVYLWIIVAGLAIIWAVLDCLALKSELNGRQKSDELFEKLQPKFNSSVAGIATRVDLSAPEIDKLES